MEGETSSYLRGDDTSKLVTPSEACWEETSRSYAHRIATVRAVALLLVCSSVLFLPSEEVKETC